MIGRVFSIGALDSLSWLFTRISWSNTVVTTLERCTRKALIICVTLMSISSNAQLTEFPSEHVPCRYLETGRQDLEAAGYDKDNPANRIQFSWFHQPKEGQTECSYKAGQADSCERVSYLIRVRTGCFLGLCQRVQVVYHYDGGLKPSDFCRID